MTRARREEPPPLLAPFPPCREVRRSPGPLGALHALRAPSGRLLVLAIAVVAGGAGAGCARPAGARR